MASRTLDVKISASDSASAVFEKVGDSAQSMGKAVEEAAKSSEGMKSFAETIKGLDSEINTVGKAFTGFGAGVTAAVAVGVKQFADLEVAMTNVSTIAGQSDQWIQQMTGNIRNLAVELGTSPTGLAEGLYDIIGSGIEASEAFDVLRTSAIAAKAGMTDTATAASAITAAINAYGKSAKEAGNIADVFFKTVDTGVLTFEELATSLGRTLPLAASLNVSIEELGAAYAQLTLQGISASEAETMIAAVMTAAISPTEELTRAVQEYGYESAEALIQAEGFVGFLRFLEQEAGGSSQRMSELTGNVRATNGALALTRNEMEEYNAALADMNTAAQDGAFTNEVFARQMETLSANLAQARAAWADLSITIGTAVAPAIGAAADIMTTWANLLRAVPEPLQNLASIAISAAGGISLFAGGLLLMVPRIADTVSALSSLNAALLRAGVSLAAIGATVSTAVAVFAALAPPVIAASATMGNFINALQDGHSPSEALTLSFYQLGTAMQQLARGDVVGFFRTLVHGVEEAESSIDKFNETAAKLWHEAARQQALGNTEVAKSLNYLTGATSGALVEAEKYLQSQEFLNDAKTMAIQMSISEATAQQLLRNEWTLSSTELGVYTEAVDALMAAMLDPETDLPALSAEFQQLTSDLYAGRITLDDYTDGVVGLAREYGHLPNDVGEATEKIKEFNATAADGAKALATLFGYEPTENNPAAAIQEIIGKNEEAGKSAEETAKKFQDATKGVHQSIIDWIADGDNILGFLDEMSVKAREGTEWFEQFADREWKVTLDITEANAAFDQILRIFDQIDALASRPQRAASIATELVGEPGEWAVIDDLLESGRIKLDQYYATVESGYAIMESAGRQEMILNEIRADQLPLLEQQTLAYERNLERLAALEPAEQRRALLLQDTAVQSQIASLYSQAYAASVGEIPEEVATAVILEAAQADEGLKDLLLQFGLIEEMPDGELRVNFPDADETINAIDRMTLAFLHLHAAQQGISAFDLAVNIYGQEEAEKLFGLVEEADGTEATMAVSVDGAAAAVDEVQFAYDIVTRADGTTAYMAMVVDEDGNVKETGEIVNSLLSADGKSAHIQIETEGGEQYIGLIDMESGEISRTIRLNFVPEGDIGLAGAVTGTSGMSGVLGALGLPESVDIKVNAVSGDGTGGAENVNDLLGIPETVDTTLNVTTTGTDDVETVSTAIAELPESKTATVGITVTGLEDLESAKTAIDELDDKSVTVSITGDAGGADGALTVLDNLKSGGKEGHQVTVKLVADDSDVTSAIANLTGAAGGGTEAGGGGGPQVTVTFIADTSALDLENLNLGSLYPDGLEVSVAVTTTGHDTAVTNLNNVQSAAEAVPETADVTTTVYAWAAAVNNLNAVQSAAESIPTSVTTGVNVSGWVSAVAALNSVANAANNIPRSVSTTVTTNVVTNRITSYSTIGTSPFALGGMVPEFASGGLVSIRGGEHGPEIARFANGGTALLPHDGFYAVPPLTTVIPAHASSSQIGGSTYVFDFKGATFGSEGVREEVLDVLQNEIVPQMEAAQRRRLSMVGVQ